MPPKKAQVPSKELITISQKISQLFENLRDESEISDPSQQFLPVSLFEENTDGFGFGVILGGKYKANLNDDFFQPFTIPSPNPEKGKSSHISPEKKPAVSPSSEDVIGFYIDKNNLGVGSTPFTAAGKKVIQEKDNSISLESPTESEYILSIPFTSTNSGKSYQLLLELGNNQSGLELDHSDQFFIRSILDYLLALLERSI